MSASLVLVLSAFSLEYVLKRLCFSPGVIPDESKAMSLLAPANALAGMLPGGGLLPTPNPLASVSFHDAFVLQARICFGRGEM